MNTTEPLYQQGPEKKENLVKPGFLNRFIARAIDFIIVAALFEIIPKVGYFAGLAYLLLSDGLFNGRSLGKRLIGLKVIVCSNDESIKDCSYKESIFRNIPFAAGYILSGIIAVIPLIGWLVSFVIVAVILVFESLVIVGSDNGMRLGDEIARTRVVEDKKGGLDAT